MDLNLRKEELKKQITENNEFIFIAFAFYIVIITSPLAASLLYGLLSGVNSEGGIDTMIIIILLLFNLIILVTWGVIFIIFSGLENVGLDPEDFMAKGFIRMRQKMGHDDITYNPETNTFSFKNNFGNKPNIKNKEKLSIRERFVKLYQLFFDRDKIDGLKHRSNLNSSQEKKISKFIEKKIKECMKKNKFGNPVKQIIERVEDPANKQVYDNMLKEIVRILVIFLIFYGIIIILIAISMNKISYFITIDDTLIDKASELTKNDNNEEEPVETFDIEGRKEANQWSYGVNIVYIFCGFIVVPIMVSMKFIEIFDFLNELGIHQVVSSIMFVIFLILIVFCIILPVYSILKSGDNLEYLEELEELEKMS